MPTSTVLIVDWNSPAYREAKYGTLEYWQYRAACYVQNGPQGLSHANEVRMAIGKIALEMHEKDGPANIWHATAKYFDKLETCYCGRCMRARELSACRQ